MKSLQRQLPRITFILLALSVAVLATRGLGDTTRLLIIGSLAMFACCWSSAIHLLGARAALHFVLIAVTLGWAAEELGSQYGWFFGDYTYTDVLGPTVGSVPFVIPLMWFALAYIAYVLSNLMVWQTPSDGATPLGQTLTQSFLALGDLTPASASLALVTALLPVGIAYGLLRALKARTGAGLVDYPGALALAAVLQWLLVLAVWKMIPVVLWR